MTEATLLRAGERPVLKFERHLQKPVDDVWRAVTTFVLTEELDANAAARNAAGWDACLDQLQLGIAGEPWKPRFDRYVAAFEPVLGAQEGPPDGYVDPDG